MLNIQQLPRRFLQVSFDGHQQIRVELKEIELFKEKTKGICGFLDNRYIDEVPFRDSRLTAVNPLINNQEYIKVKLTITYTDR